MGALLGSQVALLFAAAAPAAASTLPAGFRENVVFSGLNQPINVEFSRDGRVFVAERSGLIKVFDSMQDTSASVFADLRTQVHNFWDRGLLGMALAPDFPNDPSLYVQYTHDAAIGATAPRWGQPGVSADNCPTPPGPTSDGCLVSGRISRLNASGSTASSETVLVEDWCQQFPSHSIGTIAFGPEGMLYAGGGDGGSFNYADYGQDSYPSSDITPDNPCGDPPGAVGTALTPPTAEGGALRSQDLRTPADPTTLDGTIIRIDPTTGAAAPGNPLAASADPNAQRIVGYGFRNPWRFTLRPGTNEVWVSDVGWGAWEEIDRVDLTTGAGNFGWPCYEGAGRQGGYDGANLNICETLYSEGPAAVRAPYYAYRHSDRVVAGETCPTGGSAIGALDFYEGGRYPDAYDGALFFSDAVRGCIWAMRPGADGLPNPASIETFAAGAGAVVDLQVGPGGDLFYVDLYGGTVKGIGFGGGAPTASITASPTSGVAPLTVAFDGNESFDPDPGDTIDWAWDLDGDGLFNDSTSPTPTYTYTTPGVVNVGLRVTDPGGATGEAYVTITVDNSAPTPTITAPSPSTTWQVGDVISFSGAATDPQQGELPASALTWQVILHHCPSTCHAHVVTSFDDGVSSGTFTAPDHEYPSWLELRLTATDSGGLSGSASVRVDPRTVDITLASSPAGMNLGLNAEQAVAPLARPVIVGSSNSISAPSPQSLAGQQYDFASWSDGGAATHNVTAPATATTYTATFSRQPVQPLPPPPNGGWRLNGSAVLQGSDLVLTPASGNKAGSAIWPTAVTTEGLVATFTAQITGGNGADGLTLSLLDPAQSSPTSLGYRGGGLGYGGLRGVAIALDTYQNSGDPSRNFVGVATGTRNALDRLAWARTSTSVSNLRSGTHTVEVRVTGGRVKVTVDGALKIDVAVAMPQQALIAFTAGTGGLHNRHIVRAVSVTPGAG